ncbi:MAG: hypothetical protein LBQ34_06535 [Alphaproteobacteria bacterium]|jgi:DNA/RNA-binding domain of Phe-tRNA-synthetase-like protein|nr:hypothetical protein [Alphaproteobacteria bacterium]
MKVSVETDVFALFPDLEIFGLAVYGLNIPSLQEEAVAEFYKPDVKEGERVASLWQEIYTKFPHDKKSRASINYLTNASHKNTLKKIHPLVDIYNQASLLSLSPFGGEDISLLSGALKVALSNGNEPFLPLGKNTVENPVVGEVVYLDGNNKVVCRSMNWLESDIHKITNNTKDVIFVSERPLLELPSSNIGMNFLLQKLANCSTSHKSFVLNKDNSKVDF